MSEPLPLDLVAERIRELESQLQTKDALIKKLIECVEFYAEFENYGANDISRTDGKPCHNIILYDFDRNINGKHYGGKKARQILKRIGGEGNEL